MRWERISHTIHWEYRQTVLVLCTLALFVTVFGRLAISPIIPNITAEFGTSNALLGTALTGMWLAYAMTQFPSGILADRFGDRLVIFLSVTGTGLTALLIVVSPTLGVFFVGTVLLGGVAGLHYSVGTAFLTRIYDDIGTAIGIHNAGAPLAGLLAPIVVSWIAVRYGWRPAVALTAIVAFIVGALLLYGIRPVESREPDLPMSELVDWESMTSLLLQPPLVFTGVIAIGSEFTWQAIASFLPTFFVEYHGHSQTLAGTLFAVYFVVQGVLQIGVGALADHFGRDIAIGVAMLTGIGGLGLIVRGPDLPVIVVGIVLLGIGMAWSAAVFPRFMDQVTEDERSVSFGLFRTVYMIIAAPGSVAVGLFADLFGWAIAFGFLIVVLILICGLLIVNQIFGLEY